MMDALGLGNAYRDVPVEICDQPLSAHVEVAQWLATEEKRRGKRPVVMFRQIKEHPGARVLGNPYPREVCLAALGLSGEEWQRGMKARLEGPAPAIHSVPAPWHTVSGLDALPVLQHRPGDAGRYITAGVCVSRDPETGRVNLGVYRIQVVGPERARIFFDPRTDGYRNWQASLQKGRPLPVAIFLGASPIFMLVAASRLPTDEDDYHVASRLAGHELTLAGEPPVPVDASYVIYGVVTDELETEGPFAEFKGYYVDARQSPVLRVTKVVQSTYPVYPTIVTGAESGLTLMTLQNEYLMYAHLVAAGFPIKQVRYLLEGRGEFVTLLETDHPSDAVVRAALAFDLRTKMLICGPQLTRPWDALATYGFRVYHEPYYRKGAPDGERVGLILDRPPTGTPVEY
jgi:2,5-furandicarboxylate decarboxylase 1